MTGARHYRAFGLVIRSELALWPDEIALPEPTAAPDIEVVFGGRPAALGTRFALGTTSAATRIEGIGSIVVESGRRIEITGDASIDDSTLAACATGPGLAMALHQRGALVLHGSCIAVGPRAVCIVGPSGAGKSTLAGAALRRGHTLVSDGMTAIVQGEDETSHALFGPSCARLWPDAANHLGWRADTLPRSLATHDKRVCPIPHTGLEGSVHIEHVLEACAGEPPELRPLGAAAGLMALVRNSFLADFLDAASAPALLQHCARMNPSVRVGGLIRGTSLDQLDAVLRLLEQLLDASAISDPPGAAEVARGQ